MVLRLYDTRAKQEREFVPHRASAASMYVCGATVQGPAHLGHLRSAVVYDVLRRWLTCGGLDVLFVRNVTDIEDKILAAAADAGRPWWEWASAHERTFDAAYRAVGCLPPSISPRATGHVPQMIELMHRLIDGDHAYAVPGGDVYFDVHSYPDYGGLSGQRLEQIRPGDPGPGGTGKRDARDFTLWKAARPGEPSWPSPWGRGPPGMAPGVLRHVDHLPGRRVRHPRRWSGPAVPAPRERARAVPVRRRRVRPLLDPQRVDHGG